MTEEQWSEPKSDAHKQNTWIHTLVFKKPTVTTKYLGTLEVHDEKQHANYFLKYTFISSQYKFNACDLSEMLRLKT